RLPCVRMPPPWAVEAKAAASLPITLTFFRFTEPTESTPGPVGANPPVMVSPTRRRPLPDVVLTRVRPASRPSRVAEGFPSKVKPLALGAVHAPLVRAERTGCRGDGIVGRAAGLEAHCLGRPAVVRQGPELRVLVHLVGCLPREGAVRGITDEVVTVRGGSAG